MRALPPTLWLLLVVSAGCFHVVRCEAFEEILKPRQSLKGHTDSPTTLAFSPDAETLASGSNDQTIKLWDLTTGKERATLRGHTAAVAAVIFSPNGTTLASASNDKTVKLWDVATGKLLASLDGHAEIHSAVAYSPDGNTLAVVGADKTVKLWDAVSGKERATLHGHTKEATAVTFSPDGKTLASASHDKTVRLWDVTTGKERSSLTGHSEVVWDVKFSPDGKTLASGSGDATVILWEVATGKERATLRASSEPVWSVAFSPDGKTLAAGSRNDKGRLWDINILQERATLQGDTNPVTISPDGKFMASASMDHAVKLWSFYPARKVTRVLRSEHLDLLWFNLAAEDATHAYRSMRTLVAAPGQTVALVKDCVRPVSPSTPPEINHWIADLDSSEFAVRESAGEELEKQGEMAEHALRTKLAEKPPLDVRQRIEQLLSRLEPKVLRTSRAVELLEYLGTAEAKEVLKTLAAGADGARLTAEARASLARMAAKK